MKNSYWDNVLKLFKGHESSDEGFLEELHGDSSFDDFEKNLLGELNKDSNRPIFIIGPWGSGKTTHLLEFVKRSKARKSRYIFYERSFFGVRSLEEAYLLLTSWPWRLIFLLCLFSSLTFFGQAFLKSWVLVFELAITLFLLFIFINRYKFVYWFLSCFSSVFLYPNYKEVFVLEDLDRSSLSEEDRWAVLSNLWTSNRRYIISLGYSGDENVKHDVIENATKLNGVLIYVPANHKVHYSIACELDEDFPFEVDKATWLELFTPRMIIEISEQVGGKGELVKEFPAIKKIYYINMYYWELCRKFGQMLDSGSSVDFDGLLSQEFTPRELKISCGNSKVPQYGRNYLAKFGMSISTEFLGLLYEYYEGISDKKSSNWFAVEMSPILIKNIPIDFIDKIKAM